MCFQSDIKFVKSDKALEVDESTIPSDLDDPNNSQPLSNLIACRRYVLITGQRFKNITEFFALFLSILNRFINVTKTGGGERQIKFFYFSVLKPHPKVD